MQLKEIQFNGVRHKLVALQEQHLALQEQFKALREEFEDYKETLETRNEEYYNKAEEQLKQFKHSEVNLTDKDRDWIERMVIDTVHGAVYQLQNSEECYSGFTGEQLDRIYMIVEACIKNIFRDGLR